MTYTPERLFRSVIPGFKPRPEKKKMTYIIAEPCVNTKDAACVDVCPVECIYECEPEPGNLELPMFIHPDECIDCGACEPECPVQAIFPDTDVPGEWKEFIAKNYAHFDCPVPARD